VADRGRSQSKRGTRSPSGGSTSAKRSAAAKKAAETRKANAAKRSQAAKKAAATRSSAERSASTRKAADTRSSGDPDISAKSPAELRVALSKRLIDPLGLVMLTRERIEEALGDAVTRGRVTADDAQDLLAGLLERGRRQTNDVLSDLEQLLGRGRDEAAKQVDPVIARADRARRAAGLGPSFPITGYEDLTATQVQARLPDLNPAELRKVRDYERRNANRKTVLGAIEDKLA